jgi:hypothetical protein
MVENILYAGPSWANRSYDSLNEPYELTTNLYKEWDIKVIDISQEGANNRQMYNKTKRWVENNDIDHIIWVMCEPLSELDSLADVLLNDEYQLIRYDLMRDTMVKLNALGVKVGLIGAHADVINGVNVGLDNIEVIHGSWQQMLCEHTGVKNLAGWGADNVHVALVENENINPSVIMVKDMFECFQTWKRLVDNGVFYEVHPTRNGTKVFANHTMKKIKEWLDE